VLQLQALPSAPQSSRCGILFGHDLRITGEVEDFAPIPAIENKYFCVHKSTDGLNLNHGRTEELVHRGVADRPCVLIQHDPLSGALDDFHDLLLDDTFQFFTWNHFVLQSIVKIHQCIRRITIKSHNYPLFAYFV
jgi:hypothetical protein